MRSSLKPTSPSGCSDSSARAFAIERARSRSRTDRLVVGEPVLLDDGLWWVARDEGGRRLVVVRDDGRKAKEIARWEANACGRVQDLPGPPAPSPSRTAAAEPTVTVAQATVLEWDLERELPLDQQTPTSPRTLTWLREVRDRHPGSPLEEWVALAEARNRRLAAGRWPPKSDG